MKTKICSKCKIEKSLEEFEKSKGGLDNVRGDCRDCHISKSMEIYYKHKRGEPLIPKVSKYTTGNPTERIRSMHLQLTYGITIAEYEQIFYSQEGCCAICGKHQSEFKKRLHVDHDHKTGIVRGLLCSQCNHGIGNFEDSTDLLIKAVNYLDKHH